VLELHSRPWADSLRPSLQTLQSSLLGHARRLWDYDLKAWKDGRRAHLVFWGPPGCGKTTLALLLAESQTGVPFRQLSAVRDGMSEIKKAIDSLHGGGLLFIDEIHRLTRPQQDVLLPPLESGSAWLLAATTENPAGVLSPALLSRIRTVRVHPPKPEELEALFRKSFQEYLSTLPSCANQDANKIERINTEWIPCIAKRCDGDVRLGLNLLESLVNAHDAEAERDLVAGQLRAWTSKSHYDFASAMIKSMRGSDPDAALFYAHAGRRSPRVKIRFFCYDAASFLPVRMWAMPTQPHCVLPSIVSKLLKKWGCPKVVMPWLRPSATCHRL